MAKGVSIAYGDVAPEAKENFTPTASETYLNSPENLKKIQKYNFDIKNYACPGEFFQTILDGNAVAFDVSDDDGPIGLWSDQLSAPIDNATELVPPYAFDEPITLTLTSDGQYSSQGLTLTFDKFNNIHPVTMTIQWFRVEENQTVDLSGEMEFNPDSGVYFCQNYVENFNKIIIKFYDLNMPSCRLKVQGIDYGYGTVFYGSELRNVKISQSVDPISSEIKIDTFDFSLDSHTDMNYSFQAKQPLSVKFNDKHIATVFVKSSKRKAKFLWDVSAEDYIGIMDSTIFVGDIYNNVMAGTILEMIFKVAKVPYSIDDEFYSYPLSGYIPYTTCREALMQVCFACMAVVNTANTDVVEIKKLEDDVKQTIELDRIMQGQSFDNGDTLTKVELTAHTYSKSDDYTVLYEAEDSGTCENLFIKFSEPLHSLKGSSCEIIESGTNYAIITINNTTGWFRGSKYNHTETIHTMTNPKVLASEKENVSSITSATLISQSNVNAVLENCYDWLSRVDKTNLKIVVGKKVERESTTAKWGETLWGKSKFGTVTTETISDQEDINLGEVITAQTEYLGDVTGRVIQQSFNLNGNILVKETVIK